MSKTVRVRDATQEATEHYNVDKVFFINPATHSDAEYLSEAEHGERVLFINAALALSVEWT
jgi:hypothetical protein